MDENLRFETGRENYIKPFKIFSDSMDFTCSRKCNGSGIAVNTSAGGTMSKLSSHAKRERYYCSRQYREYLTIQKENKFNHKELYEVF
jgi:hypothetical protein